MCRVISQLSSLFQLCQCGAFTDSCSQVLVNWRLTPGEAISELAGDGAMSVVLDASLADDADDTTALIRTLRPIREVSPVIDAAFGVRVPCFLSRTLPTSRIGWAI